MKIRPLLLKARHRMQKQAAANSVSIPVVEPYNLALSLRAMRSFQPSNAERHPGFRIAARVAGKAAVIEVSQDKENKLIATSRPAADDSQVRTVVEWVLFTELDIKPFYRLITENPKLAFITKKLYGLKPSRPASLFEMAVTAITEQQLSLASAYSIRNRIVQRFGEPVEDLRVFLRLECWPVHQKTCATAGCHVRNPTISGDWLMKLLAVTWTWTG
jgi:3-methyladenine DNA glycosylase/8-oxoguanine DNA glycosylase